MKRLHEIAARIGWKTRKWDFKFELLTVRAGHQQEYGIRIGTVQHEFREHSLVSFFISLPNRTTRRRVVVEEWDLFWMHQKLWKRYDSLTESLIWNPRIPSTMESVELWILDRLFR